MYYLVFHVLFRQAFIKAKTVGRSFNLSNYSGRFFISNLAISNYGMYIVNSYVGVIKTEEKHTGWVLGHQRSFQLPGCHHLESSLTPGDFNLAVEI